MKIGTDISLQVCKDEGYPIMEFDGRKKFDPDYSYDFYAYYPDYIIQDNCSFINEFRYHEIYSLNELIGYYLENKKVIDGFIGDNHDNAKDYKYHEMLWLFSDLKAYGII